MKSSSYNHNSIGTADKPLILNLEFKQVHESLERCEVEMYEDFLKKYSFEAYQKRILQDAYSKLRYLNSDVVSMFNNKTYGVKGEIVKIISLSNNVAIVEDKKSDRFPVKISNLSEATIAKDPVKEQKVSKNISQKRVQKQSSIKQKTFF